MRTVIAGMRAGAHSIDDLDALRASATSRRIGDLRTPSKMTCSCDRSPTLRAIDPMGMPSVKQPRGAAAVNLVS